MLENEPDHFVSEMGPGLTIEAPDLAPTEFEDAVIGSVEQTDDVEQGTFADS
jgi:hypothetical protein